MFNILKAEFKKLFKGKLIYILMAGSLVFAFLAAFLFKMLDDMLPDMGIEMGYISQFGSIFTPLNNIGLLLTIFVIIIGTSEFSQRTIRNKLTGGYSRSTIYLASYIKLVVIALITVTLTFIFTYLFLLIMVGTDNTAFLDYLNIYVIGVTSLLVLYAIINLIIFKLNTFGKVFGVTIALLLLTMIIFTIVQIKASDNLKQIITYIAPLITLSNVTAQELNDFLIIIFVNIFYIIGITSLGLVINNKTDYV